MLQRLKDSETDIGQRARHHSAALLFCFLGFAAPAFAQTSADPREAAQGGVFRIAHDNDIFFWEDRDYTSGLSLARARPLADRTGVFVRALDRIGGVQSRPAWGNLELAQAIYTPGDINDPNPPAEERRYAGVLYATFGAAAETASGGAVYTDLRVGVAGPSALGEETQKALHELTSFAEPAGWDNQTSDRLVASVRYARARQVWRAAAAGKRRDLVGHIALSAGNLDTSAQAGLTARFGPNLPAPKPMRISSTLPEPIVGRDERDSPWFAFVGLGARYTALDVSFEGADDVGSTAVRKRLSAESWAGVEWRMTPSLTGAVMVTRRTRDFDGRDPAFSDVGSVALTWTPRALPRN